MGGQYLEITGLDLIGNNPKTKILFFLINNIKKQDIGWTRKKLCNNLKMSPRTIQRLIPILLKEKSLIIHRIIGTTRLYKLNEKQILIKKLIKSEICSLKIKIKN